MLQAENADFYFFPMNRDYAKSLAQNIEQFGGTRDIIIFNDEGHVFSHNMKSLAVKKAVMVFLFHHLTAMLTHSANQFSSVWYMGRSAGALLMIGQLTGNTYVAVTADATFPDRQLFDYMEVCRQHIKTNGLG